MSGLLNITGKQDDSMIWKLQLQQAGLFTLKGFSEEQRKQVLNGMCMNIIYPYACAEVRSLVASGGFQAIYMRPMNFDAMYEAQQKAELAKAGSGDGEVVGH